MHTERNIRTIEGMGSGGVVALAALGVALGAAAIPTLTPVIADVVLVVLGLGSFGAAGYAWSMQRWLGSLPLELAPVVGRGRVDGQIVYRFRARLGRGRALHDPSARVRWEPASGEPIELEAVLPARSLCGPFTILVPDPMDRVDGPGRFYIEVEVESRGRAWIASGSYPEGAIHGGRFGGILTDKHGILWGEGWLEIDRSTPEDQKSG